MKHIVEKFVLLCKLNMLYLSEEGWVGRDGGLAERWVRGCGGEGGRHRGDGAARAHRHNLQPEHQGYHPTLQGKANIYVFLFWELQGLIPIYTFMCLWGIHIFPGSVHIFTCNRIDRPILEIYKSPTIIWVLELGGRTLLFCFGNNSFFSGNT
jgi:hypothetical protein